MREGEGEREGSQITVDIISKVLNLAEGRKNNYISKEKMKRNMMISVTAGKE